MTRHFQWERLARYDAAQAAATNRCVRLLGARGVLARDDVAELFSELGFDRFDVKLAHVSAHRGAIFQPEFGSGFATNFFVPGVGTVGAITVDHSLVETVLHRIAGVPTTGVVVDEWEFGLLTWILLRCASALATGGAPPVTFIAERRPPERLAEEVAGPWTVHEIVVDVWFDGRRGWVRLFVPEPSLTQFLGEESRFRPPVTGALARVQCKVDLVAGETELRASEVAGLGFGDVVLFERHAVTLGRLEGDAPGRVAVTAGSVAAEVAVADGEWQFTICDEASGNRRERAGGKVADDTTQLTDDAWIAIETVVGRASLSFSDLARLKPGQILVGDRAVGDPVDLVANGTTVARGELVDVDGRLGVRVLSLAT